MWRTTNKFGEAWELAKISIHVLRVEDDPPRRHIIRRYTIFQSTSSVWRTTLFRCCFCASRYKFQSTSSVWRTTQRGGRSWVAQNHFNPRPPCGGRPRHCDAYARTGRISIHVLRVEDDHSDFMRCAVGFYFNPRPPCGGRRRCHAELRGDQRFQSTSSVWRTTVADAGIGNGDPDFNPRPPCGGRPGAKSADTAAQKISIHVLRVEDDGREGGGAGDEPDFNPRPPCGGRRRIVHRQHSMFQQFQSTSSVWRTTLAPPCVRGAADFNPRPPCGGRPGLGWAAQMRPYISIHVLRVEDDALCHALPGGARLFQSTSSVWRTTPRPRDGGEARVYFNPRPPCGGRHGIVMHTPERDVFQSTSSVWRTTVIACAAAPQSRRISIHVLRVEDDLTRRSQWWTTADFNPRPPCGGRPSTAGQCIHTANFNPRPPCGGRQQKQRKISICIHYNTAICTDLQLKQSAYAFVCTDRDK